MTSSRRQSKRDAFFNKTIHPFWLRTSCTCLPPSQWEEVPGGATALAEGIGVVAFSACPPCKLERCRGRGSVDDAGQQEASTPENRSHPILQPIDRKGVLIPGHQTARPA